MGKDLIKTMYDTYWYTYEEHLRNSGENAKNIPNRKSTIKKFFSYLCEFDNKPDFKDIEKVHIQTFLSVQEKECSPKTVNRYFSFLKDFFMYYKKESINKNIIFEHWTYHKSINNDYITVTDEEVKDLYNIIESYGCTEQSMRLKIAFLLLTYTGCTKDELCSLNIYRKAKLTNDVYNYIVLEEKKVYFGKRGKGNKSKSRDLPLSDFIIENLIDYMNFMEKEKGVCFEKYPYLFTSIYFQENGSVTRLKSDQINAALKNLIKESTVVKNKKTSFQAFRNTFIKNLIDNKVPFAIIKSLTGLDIASFKRFQNIEQYEKEQKEEVMKKKHPFKKIFSE